MFTASTKKQNRVLLVTLIVLLLSIALLVAITGGANKKSTDESNPPIESSKTESDSAADDLGSKIIEKTDESEHASDDVFGSRDKTQSSGETSSESTDKSAESVDESRKTSNESEADIEVSISPSSSLPDFISPVNSGIVLKRFSGTTPVFSYTMNDYRTHRGVDFACSVGTPVYAAAEGVVCEINDDPMMGVTIGIEHSGGAVTRYMGLAEDSIDMNSIGDSVYCGQVIGASGDTALIESAEEAHVHFELTVNGEACDPSEYMDVTFISDIHED